MKLLVCLVGIAFAYDDQSLMQQNLGVEGGEAHAQLREAVSTIIQARSELTHMGKLRSMALDGLLDEMQQTAGKDNMSDTLDEIKELLAQLEHDLIAERNASQEALDLVHEQGGECNVVGPDSNDQDNFHDAKYSHDVCRNVHEQDKRADAESTCGDMTTEMEARKNGEVLTQREYIGPIGTHPWPTGGHVPDGVDEKWELHCTDYQTSIPAFDQVEARIGEDVADGGVFIASHASIYAHIIQHLTRWTNGFVAIIIWYNAVQTNLFPLVAPCQTDLYEFAAQRSTCHLSQKTMEDRYCDWRYARRNMCTQRKSCWDEKENQYNNLVTAEIVTAAQRVHECRMLRYVDCAIDVLKTNESNITECQTKWDSSLPSYPNGEEYGAVIEDCNVTVQTFPAEADCDKSTTLLFPKDTDWYNLHFANVTVRAPASDDETCAQCCGPAAEDYETCIASLGISC